MLIVSLLRRRFFKYSAHRHLFVSALADTRHSGDGGADNDGTSGGGTEGNGDDGEGDDDNTNDAPSGPIDKSLSSDNNALLPVGADVPRPSSLFSIPLMRRPLFPGLAYPVRYRYCLKRMLPIY